MNVEFWRHSDSFPSLTKLRFLHNIFERRRNLDTILSPFGNFSKNNMFSIKMVQLQCSVSQGHL